MIDLTGEQAADYFRRCYSAVDGLWCMKVEEKYGFDIALDVDHEVWKVFPKIQARKLKELTGLGNGIEALYECLTTRFELEGYSYRAERLGDDGSFRIVLDDCPWHNIIVGAGRGHLSEQVGGTICPTEFSVWAAEFSAPVGDGGGAGADSGGGIRTESECRICAGAETCAVRFSR